MQDNDPKRPPDDPAGEPVKRDERARPKPEPVREPDEERTPQQAEDEGGLDEASFPEALASGGDDALMVEDVADEDERELIEITESREEDVTGADLTGDAPLSSDRIPGRHHRDQI